MSERGSLEDTGLYWGGGGGESSSLASLRSLGGMERGGQTRRLFMSPSAESQVGNVDPHFLFSEIFCRQS